jgi:cytochrome c-type biogenesis protein CcmH
VTETVFGASTEIWATVAFWASAGVIALLAALMLLRALRNKGGLDLEAAAFDRQVYRDQLSEIERDLARGVIAEDEAVRLRSEVARRLLAADRMDASSIAARPGPSSLPVMATIALVLAAGFGGYAYVGQPGYSDLPLAKRIAQAETRRSERPSQAELEAALPPRLPLSDVDPEFVVLVDQLRAAVAQRPDDLQGQMLLARNEANLGNLIAAYTAQENVIALKGDAATIGDLLTQATLMIQAAEGQVSPQADVLLQKVLARDPANDTALFFSGITNMQVGRYDIAFQQCKTVIETAPATSPWMAQVRDRIESLAEIAGVRFALPETLLGPDAAAIAAAEEMTTEEQDAMVRSMVETLNDRLATEGGTAQEWARLISALAILGETERARAIWAEALRNFAGRTAELGFINQEAVNAGLTR